MVQQELRLAELMAALSIATDLAMGQPLEFALESCLVAVRLGEALGLDEEHLHDVYYQALLRYIGCNAETAALAAIAGDELTLRSGFVSVDAGDTGQVLGFMVRTIRQANGGASPLALVRSLVSGITRLQRYTKSGFGAHCEVAQRLAERLGFGERVIRALGQLYERWDGKGAPNGIKGEAIEPAVLIVALAQDALTFCRLGGVDAAVRMVRERRGKAYPANYVDTLTNNAGNLLGGSGDETTWDCVLACEPGAPKTIAESGIDEACRVIGDFVDIKSTYLLGHSKAVGDLAARAAARAGLPAGDATLVRRAGYVHDVGRAGVSTAIWNKPGPLSDREWERVRLHPYYGQQILARPGWLAEIGQIASHHHERVDGSGYYRQLPGPLLGPLDRILAAADCYQAMCEERPHRAPLSDDQAADALRREARAGRLDSDAVTWVLEAAGHRVRRTRRDAVAGLTEREIEVLRLVARGQTIRQIAQSLVISDKTAGNHIQHIYDKIDVTTRAGAALFAVEHSLL